MWDVIRHAQKHRVDPDDPRLDGFLRWRRRLEAGDPQRQALLNAVYMDSSGRVVMDSSNGVMMAGSLSSGCSCCSSG